MHGCKYCSKNLTPITGYSSLCADVFNGYYPLYMTEYSEAKSTVKCRLLLWTLLRFLDGFALFVFLIKLATICLGSQLKILVTLTLFANVRRPQKNAEKNWSKPKLKKTFRLLKLRLKPIADCIEFAILFHRHKLQVFLSFL